jgi:hypothetical protein
MVACAPVCFGTRSLRNPAQSKGGANQVHEAPAVSRGKNVVAHKNIAAVSSRRFSQTHAARFSSATARQRSHRLHWVTR